MMKDVEIRRVDWIQKIQKSQKVFDHNGECTELLLQKGGFPNTSSPIVIGDMSLDLIASVKASLLEAFERVRRKEDDWEKWKAPSNSKGTVAKVNKGLVCSTTKDKFLIVQVPTFFFLIQ